MGGWLRVFDLRSVKLAVTPGGNRWRLYIFIRRFYQFQAVYLSVPYAALYPQSLDTGHY